MGRTGIYACGESVSRHNSSELVVLFSLKQEASASIGGGTFTHYSILRMKKIAPALKYGLLTETWLVHPGAYTKALGVACYHPYYGSSPDDVIYELQAQNIEINTFTVNDADSVKRLMQKGVDIVIGNFPDMVHRVLKG